MNKLTRPSEQRRFLVMRSDNARDSIIPVDDDHTCRDYHVHGDDGKGWFGLWHLYERKDGTRVAIRCPTTLSKRERDEMLADIPPGSWVKTLEAMRELRGEEQRKSRRRARTVATIAAMVIGRLIA